jgi:hypothetical protein
MIAKLGQGPRAALGPDRVRLAAHHVDARAPRPRAGTAPPPSRGRLHDGAGAFRDRRSTRDAEADGRYSARRKRVLTRLRRLARTATADEPVFFEDEMDVHLNPKIGRDWMPRGHRRYVLTPGQNQKRYVAGALNATTGKLTWVDAPTKASEPFHKLVWKLLAEYRRAQRIHLIVDNYIIH